MATLAVEKVHIKNLEWATWFCQVDLSGLRGEIGSILKKIYVICSI